MAHYEYSPGMSYDKRYIDAIFKRITNNGTILFENKHIKIETRLIHNYVSAEDPYGTNTLMVMETLSGSVRQQVRLEIDINHNVIAQLTETYEALKDAVYRELCDQADKESQKECLFEL